MAVGRDEVRVRFKVASAALLLWTGVWLLCPAALAEEIIKISPSVPKAGETVTLDASGYDPPISRFAGGAITNYLWDLGDGTIVKGKTEAMVRHVYRHPGEYKIKLEIVFNGYPWLITTWARVTVLSPAGDLPGGQDAALKPFDLNDNDRIDDQEFFAIIDAWIAGSLDDTNFFRAIDLWVSQGRISSAGLGAGAGPRTLNTNPESGAHGMALETSRLPHGGGLTFVARGPGIGGLALTVYDVNGRVIAVQRTEGRVLTWMWHSPKGRLWANGVYFYAVEFYSTSGEIVRGEMRKFALLR